MMAPQGGGLQGRLQIQGERTSGQDVRTQNVTAVVAVANIVKSSLGPVGLDKVCAVRGSSGRSPSKAGDLARAGQRKVLPDGS